MSEQPQELANIHIEHYFPKGYNPDDEPWKSIKAHHNAAVNAERLDWTELRDILHLPSSDCDKTLVIREIKQLTKKEVKQNVRS
jgi:hypothetical protein